MSDAIRLLRLGRIPGWMSQAVYHALAETMQSDRPDTVVICTPENPYLCLGYFQNLQSVFDQNALRLYGIPVYRRRIGGGATYLDENQLFYQFVFHHSRVPAGPEKSYRFFLQAPLRTLRGFGLNARLHAVNELEVNKRRIAGIGGGRIGEAAVVVGNFLFDFDYETMSRVWKAPWPGYREIARNALIRRVYTLKHCAAHLKPQTVEDELVKQLENSFDRPVVSGRLTAEESEAIMKWRIRLEKFSDEGRSVTSRPRPLKIAAGVFVHNGACRRDGVNKACHISLLEEEKRIAAVQAQDKRLLKIIRQMETRALPAAWEMLEHMLEEAGINLESKTWPVH